MIVSETQQPIITNGNGLTDAIVEWERSLDPWHADAFPNEFRHAGTTGERKSGWMGYDWCGNPIMFIPDGTEI